MAGEINGADVVLAMSMADSASEDYQILGSQRGITFSGTVNTIDTSNKQSGRARTFIMGRKTETLTLDKLYVPDEEAYEALKTAFRNGTKIMVMRCERATPDEGDYSNVESAEAGVTQLSESAPDQEAATCNISLEISGNWTAAA